MTTLIAQALAALVLLSCCPASAKSEWNCFFDQANRRIKKYHNGWHFSPKQKVWMRWFDIRREYVVTYMPGGETTHQAKRRAKGRFAFGGGYYVSPWTLMPVDLVVVNGRQMMPYLRRKQRPVFASPPPRIVWQWKSSSILGVKFALAGDQRCQGRSRKTYRQIVGITASRVFFIRMVGTETRCRYLMKGLGITKYAFLDGGSAVGDGKRVPTHIVVR